jgi:hypothetical protein
LGKEIFIICTAYPQIKNTLYVALQHYQKQPTSLLVHGYTDLFKFFTVINEKVFHNDINIMFIDSYHGKKTKPGSKIDRVFGVLRNFFEEKRFLKESYNRCLAKFRGAEVYFFNRNYVASEFYLLRKLAASNNLIYMPAPLYQYFGFYNTTPKNLKELILLLRWKLAYGWGVSLNRERVGFLDPYIPDSFMRKYVQKTIDPEESYKAIEGLDMRRFRVFDVGNYSVIYFHDNLVGGGYVTDAAAFHKLLVDVFKIVRKHVAENKVARKLHPSPAEGEIIVKYGKLLPDYIPAEFLYNDSVKLYIGLSSAALANIEKGTVISLLDMVKFHDDITRQNLKNGLLQAKKTKILFPNSLKEFEQILVGLKIK